MMENHIATQRFTIPDAAGLDQQYATQWVKVARAFNASVTVRHGDKAADGKQVQALVALGASSGTMISVMAQGDDAIAALEALESLLHSAVHGGDGFTALLANQPERTANQVRK